MKTIGLTLVLILSVTLSSSAQQPDKKFGFEFNSGASIATAKINDSKLDPGFGFEGIFHYRFMPHLGVYGGWGWNRFGSDNSFAGNDVCFEETGYVLGLNFIHPIGDSKLSYFVRAGMLFNHVETEDSNGDIVNDSKHGMGFQLAGGIDINLGKNWSLSPGIKFNSLEKDTRYNQSTIQLDYQYLSARIGITKSF